MRCDEELLLHKFLISSEGEGEMERKLLCCCCRQLLCADRFHFSSFLLSTDVSNIYFPIQRVQIHPELFFQWLYGGSTHRWLQFLQFHNFSSFFLYQKLTIVGCSVLMYFNFFLLHAPFSALCSNRFTAQIFSHWKTFSQLHLNRNQERVEEEVQQQKCCAEYGKNVWIQQWEFIAMQ